MYDAMSAIDSAEFDTTFLAPADSLVDSLDLQQAVDSAVGDDGSVHVSVDGGTVTLDGYVRGGYSLLAVERVAYGTLGVSRVVNNLIEPS